MKKDNSQPTDDQKIVLPTISAPGEPEVPEEGFVPYCADAESDSDRRQKRKIRILIILAVLLLLSFAFTFYSRHYNFYQKTFNHLQFDYTQGEAADETLLDHPGDYACRISEQAKDKVITLHCNTYLFDENGNSSTNISVYDYKSSGNEAYLDIRIGAENSLITKQLSLRTTGNGIEEKHGDTWQSSSENKLPNLAAYCFGTISTDNLKYECAGAYETIIGKTNYMCEVWLMENNTGAQTEYTTLYRYYDGERLAGVRMLKDTETIMTVFDITDYQFS